MGSYEPVLNRCELFFGGNEPKIKNMSLPPIL